MDRRKLLGVKFDTNYGPQLGYVKRLRETQAFSGMGSFRSHLVGSGYPLDKVQTLPA